MSILIKKIYKNPNFLTLRQIFTPPQRKISYKSIKSWYAGLVKPKPPEVPYGFIVQIGDPTLRTTCKKVPKELIDSPEINFLLNRMKNVMKKYNCVGLASPQIGIPLRVIMLEVTEKLARRYSEQERKNLGIELVPWTVLINPEIKISDYSKVSHLESCESVRGLHADVPRYQNIVVKGFDEKGEVIEKPFSNWTARIIQHEIDHLDGKMYTDIMDRKTLACSGWEIIKERHGKVELAYGPE